MNTLNLNKENNETIKAKYVGELKGLLADARSKGLTVAIIKVPRYLFAIDKAYQTEERTERDLGYLINNFKREKLLPVCGVPHDEEGLIYLFDGSGRLEASGIVDERRGTHEYDYLECMVVLNAPTEPKARRKYEAEQYAFQNVGTKRVTPLQRHGAYECLEYPPVMVLNKMRDKYGFAYSKGSGKKIAGYLGSYSEAFEICKVLGEEGADYVFGVCQKAGLNLKANGYATYMLRALRDMYRLYPEYRKESAEYLSKWLRKYDPAKFKAKAVARYGMLDQKTACSLYLEDLLVDNMDFMHVREVDGKVVTMIKVA